MAPDESTPAPAPPPAPRSPGNPSVIRVTSVGGIRLELSSGSEHQLVFEGSETDLVVQLVSHQLDALEGLLKIGAWGGKGAAEQRYIARFPLADNPQAKLAL